MVQKKDLDRRKAIDLRRKGLSYSEIRKKIKVSKSSLSLWLRSVGLTKRQKQRLTEKKLASIRRGWEKWRNTRINLTNKIINEATNEIVKTKITKDKLWLMGIMLYWAEGAKSKEYRPTQAVTFSNSDPLMIKMFLLWVKKILLVKDERIKFEIYIHESHKDKNIRTRRYWSGITGFSEAKFDKIYFKKNKINSKRRNIGDGYHGLLRIYIRKSTNLNRKIAGWIQGICKKWGVV